MSLPDPSAPVWPAIPTASSATPTGVRSAIARAAGATGVDFSYLMAQARIESSLNPHAKAATSSASGLYQFTNSTWMQTVQKHGDLLGGTGSTLSALSDPSSRAQTLALRSDPNASAMMAASLAADNQGALTGVLGRSPDSSELYLAHFLGSDGAAKFLTALSANPDQSAAALMPKAAAANTSIFFDSNGGARSLAQVMGLIRAKMDTALQATSGQASFGDDSGSYANLAAMSGASAIPAAPEAPTGGPIAQEWAQAQAQMAPGSNSMADTLQATFGGGGEGGATPDFVRNAYSRLKAFGL